MCNADGRLAVQYAVRTDIHAGKVKQRLSEVTHLRAVKGVCRDIETLQGFLRP